MNAPLTAAHLTSELVRIPSESSEPTAHYEAGSEVRLAAYLAELLKSEGVPFTLQEALPGRSNLIAEFAGNSSRKILIAGHMDTVSAGGMNEPFSGQLNEGKIRGRGACDDKGPLAAALATLLHMHRRQQRMRYEVTLVATVDEECSLAGAAAFAAAHGPYDLCLCLEPTMLRIVTAHKGVYRCRITAHGRAAHSSSPENGRNAILIMHDIMKDLFLLDFRLRRQKDDELGRPSLAITKIQGGTSINIIPDRCEISVDVRLLPDQEPKLMAETIRKVVGPRGQVEDLFGANGISTDCEDAQVTAFQEALAQNGLAPEPTTASYATDGSKLFRIGPCLVWGPGDISHAHQVDEHIAIDQLEKACKVLESFLTG